MREKYHTEALIVRVSDFKEANKLYHIFSQRFGFIIATAQGVRFTKSKLRYGLQEYSLSDISVIRTGDVWKITNSVPRRNYFFDFQNEKQKLDIISRVAIFLQNFIHGEEENDLLYKDIKDSFELIGEEGIPMPAIEGALMLRSMHRLGLLKDPDNFKNILDVSELRETILNMDGRYEEAVHAVNQSLKESQL